MDLQFIPISDVAINTFTLILYIIICSIIYNICCEPCAYKHLLLILGTFLIFCDENNLIFNGLYVGIICITISILFFLYDLYTYW